ncbi:MAG: ABC transporter ATP-binding protein uup [Rhodobiaceae bacterium UBA7378]|nr:MAG: ABC transporter ATP-binding protein uup [Rhodobiaceae bacterium UBA7378]
MTTAPPILYLQDINLTYGVTPLLEGAELSVSHGARLCLVGRNGSGKSTLLRIAAGLVDADSGDRFVQPGVFVSYLAQSPDFAGFETAGDYVLQGVMDNEDKQRAHQIMADLNIEATAPLTPMSGGERRRVALAHVMAPQPDILLLDEPTNHLDLPAIEWLETSLRQINSALVVVSHDRRFLKNLTDQTVWLDRGRTRIMRKNFTHFEDWRDVELEREQQEQHKLDRKIAREEDWIRYGVSGRRKRNVRRVAELAQLRQNRQDHRGPDGQVDAALVAGEKSGKLVVKADKLVKKFGDKRVVDGFTTQIKRGDRVGLVGANGAGKTTLLKMLLGELEPDSGNVRLGKNLSVLVLDQARTGIKKDWTIKDALTDGAGDLVSIGEETMHVIGYMKNFLFHPAQMGTPANVLSGGELARLLLARGLRQPSNVLVMDEPTNDLDLETLDLLQEMIAAYDGTVILVSHDRDFLDHTVTSIIRSEDNGAWVEYAGGYSDMQAQRKAQSRAQNGGPSAQSGGATGASGTNASGDKSQVKSENQKPPSRPAQKLTYRDKYALENLPAEMEDLRVQIDACQKKLDDPTLFRRDAAQFSALADQLSAARDRLEKAEEEWLALEILREEVEGGA